MAKCRYPKRDGTPCGGVATGKHGGCFAHDPSFELARKRAARRNRKSKAGNPAGTADLARLQKNFEDLADQVLAGTVDRAAAAVAIQAWNGARACIAASARVREVEDLERRLDALEQGQKERGVV